MSGRRRGAAALAALLLSGTAAGACALHGATITGLVAAHPASIEVALASRSAIEAGLLPDLSRADGAGGDPTVAALYAVQQYLALHAATRASPRPVSIVEAAGLALVGQARAAPPRGPAYATVGLRTGLWTTFNTGPDGSRFHAEAAPPGSTVIVFDDGVLGASLAGTTTLRDAADAGLIVARGPDAEAAWQHFTGLFEAFARSEIGARMAADLADRFPPRDPSPVGRTAGLGNAASTGME